MVRILCKVMYTKKKNNIQSKKIRDLVLSKLKKRIESHMEECIAPNLKSYLSNEEIPNR